MYERDFHRLAKRTLDSRLQLYQHKTLVRDPERVVKDGYISVLLPHEFAHELWRQNEKRFRELFVVSKINSFWERTISIGEEWFVHHPLRDSIVGAADRSRFLPILLFGDDGTLRKTRCFSTLTWFPALHSREHCLHSRIPLFLMPKHILVPSVTESAAERVVVWAFDVWISGKHPHLNPDHEPWEDRHRRDLGGTDLTLRVNKNSTRHTDPPTDPPQTVPPQKCRIWNRATRRMEQC